MNWYYVDAAGQQVGPVDDAGLDALVASGVVNAETLAWREGMANWQPLRDARPGQYAAAPMPDAAPEIASGIEEAVCAECGGIFPVNETIRVGSARVCARCKPIFVQKMREGVNVDSAGSYTYAGFWIRLAAKIVDNLIIGVVVFVPAILMLVFAAGASAGNAGRGLGAMLVFEFGIIGGMFLVPVLYNGFFIGKYGATPGKMACKIYVVQPDGNAVSYGRAFGRSAAEILSRMIWCIGYIMAAFDSEKRTLHDRICNTRVVYK